MRAVFYESFGQAPFIATVPDPAPAPEGVVVKVAASGLCRSDWHGWMGHDKDIALPHVPGHELAGEVVAVGKAVKRWKPGDRVTVPFVAGCGQCSECAAGHQQVCPDQFQPGFTAWGSFAEFVALDFADTNLVRLPESMTYATAASMGCRFATAFRAVVDQARIVPGQWLAVHGCGGLGLSAISIGAAMGARIVAIDIGDDKLDLARAVGAEIGIRAGSGLDIPDAIRSATGGGAHISIDALGSVETCFNSISCLRRRGRHVQVGLMGGSNASNAVPLERVIAHELEIVGSHGMQAHRYDAMFGLVISNRVRPQDLISRHISLSAAPGALVELGGFAQTGITVIDDFEH